jgi:hypothetical protein
MLVVSCIEEEQMKRFMAMYRVGRVAWVAAGALAVAGCTAQGASEHRGRDRFRARLRLGERRAQNTLGDQRPAATQPLEVIEESALGAAFDLVEIVVGRIEGRFAPFHTKAGFFEMPGLNRPEDILGRQRRGREAARPAKERSTADACRRHRQGSEHARRDPVKARRRSWFGSDA